MESATRQVRRLAALIAPLFLIGTAHAQVGNPGNAAISFLNNSAGVAATYVSPQNPLPTTAVFSGSLGSVNTALTAGATLPTLPVGVQNFQGSRAGAAYVQPVFGSASGGGTIVDAAHPLPVTSVAPATFSTPFPTTGEAVGVRDQNGNMNWLSSDTNGSLQVNVVSGGAGGSVASAFGVAFPTAGSAAGYRDPNGNMHFGSVDLAGLFQVGNPVWTVIGAGGGTTAQRVAISSDAASNTVTLAQNPLTVIGTVNQGAAAIPTSQWPMAVYAGPNRLDVNASGQIACSNCRSTGPALDMVVGPTIVSSSGTQTLAVSTQGTGAATIVLTASSGLTATFEGLTPAGWSTIAMDNTATGQTQSSTSADGIWQTNSAGYSQIRVNVQAGTTTASLESSTGSLPTGVDSGIYMATPPTLTDGTPAGITLTNDARLRVSLATAAPTSRSGSIATGGVSQVLAASNANRRRFKLQNPCTASSQGISTAENLFYSFTGAASGGGDSYELLPCSAFDSSSGPVDASAITVFAATSGHKYKADELQ